MPASWRIIYWSDDVRQYLNYSVLHSVDAEQTVPYAVIRTSMTWTRCICHSNDDVVICNMDSSSMTCLVNLLDNEVSDELCQCVETCTISGKLFTWTTFNNNGQGRLA